MSTLIKYVQTCSFKEGTRGVDGAPRMCEVPFCAGYKNVWNHFKRCILRTFTGKQKQKCIIYGEIWDENTRVNICLSSLCMEVIDDNRGE